MGFLGCALATTCAGEPTLTVPLVAGVVTVSGNAAQLELGGAGAGGAGRGLLEGVQFAGTGAHAPTDGPGVGEGAGDGVGVGAGAGAGAGVVLGGGAGCDGCNGWDGVVCDIWCALPQAASTTAKHK